MRLEQGLDLGCGALVLLASLATVGALIGSCLAVWRYALGG